MFISRTASNASSWSVQCATDRTGGTVWKLVGTSLYGGHNLPPTPQLQKDGWDESQPFPYVPPGLQQRKWRVEKWWIVNEQERRQVNSSNIPRHGNIVTYKENLFLFFHISSESRFKSLINYSIFYVMYIISSDEILAFMMYVCNAKNDNVVEVFFEFAYEVQIQIINILRNRHS